MAKQRDAKKSAPPPPAASSEETQSGEDGSESESEEIIPASRTPAPKNPPPPPPPQKDEESETSDEEEDEEDAEKDEEDAEEEDEEDAEEEEEPSNAAPTTALKNQAPAARQSEDSDGSDEEEDGGSESDKDAPPPKQEAMAPEAQTPRQPFRRIWSTDDEVSILEALAAHKKEHGVLPQPDELIQALAGRLDHHAYSSKELQGKLQTLRRLYLTAAKKYEPLRKEHDRRLFDLSKLVWGKSTARPAPATTDAVAAKGGSHEPKGFEEMCELYPYLAEEVKKMEPRTMFKRAFGRIEADRARMLDKTIKKRRVEQMKLLLRRSDLIREVTKEMMDLID